PAQGVETVAAAPRAALVFGDEGGLPSEQGRDRGEQSPGELAEVGVAVGGVTRTDPDERMTARHLECHRVRGLLEMVDQGSDVLQDRIGGAEGGQAVDEFGGL